jgi:tartrate dehydrogenase/decarboxylase/D-malate dehydrogenase
MAVSNYQIAVIPGDGIGKEVVPEGIKVLETLAPRFDISLEFEHFDWSCERYLETGAMMPEDGIAQLAEFDAIYLGAVGFPTVLDHVSLWGLLIPIRREFQQYINLRPVRLFEGMQCPLVGKKPGDIDFYVVRENCEGEYSNIGGRLYAGTDDEMAMQQSIFTRKGTDRVLKYAYWDERAAAMAEKYPEIDMDKYHIDILVSHFVNKPEIFDVVVGSNLFGDILSDLGPGVTGTIGIAPSANINPERDFPSMFEPVHGSAPDIAGQGIANPIGQIWSAAMMLQHLGHEDAHDAIVTAIEDVIRERDNLTPDMGGSGSCSDCGAAIATRLS